MSPQSGCAGRSAVTSHRHYAIRAMTQTQRRDVNVGHQAGFSPRRTRGARRAIGKKAGLTTDLHGSSRIGLELKNKSHRGTEEPTQTPPNRYQSASSSILATAHFSEKNIVIHN